LAFTARKAAPKLAPRLVLWRRTLAWPAFSTTDGRKYGCKRSSTCSYSSHCSWVGARPLRGCRSSYTIPLVSIAGLRPVRTAARILIAMETKRLAFGETTLGYTDGPFTTPGSGRSTPFRSPCFWLYISYRITENLRSTPNNAGNRKVSRRFAQQALFYAIVFCMTWIWSMVNWVVDQKNGFVYTPIIFLQAVFVPSQGFFNTLVYLRPRYLRIRQRHSELSFLQVVQAVCRAVFGIKATNSSSSSSRYHSSYASSSRTKSNILSLNNHSVQSHGLSLKHEHSDQEAHCAHHDDPQESNSATIMKVVGVDNESITGDVGEQTASSNETSLSAVESGAAVMVSRTTRTKLY